jgi:hypothetical protein
MGKIGREFPMRPYAGRRTSFEQVGNHPVKTGASITFGLHFSK